MKKPRKLQTIDPIPDLLDEAKKAGFRFRDDKKTQHRFRRLKRILKT